jgi:hypothetical protein
MAAASNNLFVNLKGLSLSNDFVARKALVRIVVRRNRILSVILSSKTNSTHYLTSLPALGKLDHSQYWGVLLVLSLERPQ